MPSLQLHALDNRQRRSNGQICQRWRIWLRVEAVQRARALSVHWQAVEGSWHRQEAVYLGDRLDGQGFWYADWQGEALGDLNFALCLHCEQGEVWSNNHGRNHALPLRRHIALQAPLAVLPTAASIALEQRYVDVQVAVAEHSALTQPVVHWSCDGWRTLRQTACRPDRQNGAGFWRAKLPVGKAYRVDYCVVARSASHEAWDNANGSNYQMRRAAFRLLILNLHCYQEAEQDYKLSQIARAIEELAVDAVCFQEVAEPWNDGHGDWPHNAAQRINAQLSQPMHLYYDWSHLGFDRYREGLAILSRHPLLQCEARYVSDSDDAYDIHSRKVLRSLIKLPYYGLIQLFCVHLSWWENGFASQWQRLHAWAAQHKPRGLQATLIGGDFNIRSDSAGYRMMLESGFRDQYLAAEQHDGDAGHWTVEDSHWRYQSGNDTRIDFVMADADSRLQVLTAQSVFTESDYGRVSDHCGFLFHFGRR